MPVGNLAINKRLSSVELVIDLRNVKVVAICFVAIEARGVAFANDALNLSDGIAQGVCAISLDFDNEFLHFEKCSAMWQ